MFCVSFKYAKDVTEYEKFKILKQQYFKTPCSELLLKIWIVGSIWTLDYVSNVSCIHLCMQDESSKEPNNTAEDVDETPGTSQVAEVKEGNDDGGTPVTSPMAKSEVKAQDLQIVEIAESPVKEKPKDDDVEPLVGEMKKKERKAKAKAKAKAAAKAKGKATKRKNAATSAKAKAKSMKATKEKQKNKTLKPRAKASSSKRPAEKIDPVAKKMHSVTGRNQLSDALSSHGLQASNVWLGTLRAKWFLYS